MRFQSGCSFNTFLCRTYVRQPGEVWEVWEVWEGEGEGDLWEGGGGGGDLWEGGGDLWEGGGEVWEGGGEVWEGGGDLWEVREMRERGMRCGGSDTDRGAEYSIQ